MNPEVVSDAAAEPGSCVCEWDHGLIEAGLPTQLRAIASAIRRVTRTDTEQQTAAAVNITADELLDDAPPLDGRAFRCPAVRQSGHRSAAMNEVAAFIDALTQELAMSDGTTRHGKVVEAVGTLLKVGGLDATLGEQCELRDARGVLLQRAEVVGFTRQFALLAPFGSVAVAHDARYRARASVVGAGRRDAARTRAGWPWRTDRRPWAVALRMRRAP